MQLVCTNVQAESSSETPLEYNWDAFDELRQVMTLTNLGVIGILCSFRLDLEGNTGENVPELSGLQFLKKRFSENFCFIRSRR